MNRIFTFLIAAAAVAQFGTASAQSAYPERAITLVVPFGAGGVTDTMARLLAEPLSGELGQPVIVENRPGAGGLVGTESVIAADNDGYTLLYASSGPLAILPSLTPDQVRYDPLTALTHVRGISASSQVLVVPSDAPYDTVAELVAFAAENPDTLNFGSPGIGTAQHLAGELFKLATGASMDHIPYRTGGNQVADLISGVIDLSFDYSAVLAPYIDAGQLKVLATTGAERHPRFPDVPSVGEAGYPDAVNVGWTLFSVPRDTPAEIVERLSAAMESVLQSERLVTYMESNGQMSLGGYGPAEIAQFVADENEKYITIIDAAQIQID